MAVIFILISILFIGFFAGSETALISLNRIRLKYLVDKGERNAYIIHDLVGNPDRLLTSLLVGTNLFTVIATALFTNMMEKSLGENAAVLTTLVLVPFILIFGDIIPKVIFRQKANQITFVLAWPLLFFYRLFKPIVSAVSSIATSIIWLLGQGYQPAKNLFVTREELKHIIRESEREGIIKPTERSIIYKIFDFGRISAKSIMVPLERIVSVPKNATIRQLKESAKKSGFFMIPVYDKDMPNFIGAINVLDILYKDAKDEDTVLDYIHPVFFVSMDALIDKVLFTMQVNKQSIAIVTDNNAKIIGMVTIEDLLENIIGDIS